MSDPNEIRARFAGLVGRDWSRWRQFREEEETRYLRSLTVDKAYEEFLYLYEIALEQGEDVLRLFRQAEFPEKLRRIRRMQAAFSLLSRDPR